MPTVKEVHVRRREAQSYLPTEIIANAKSRIGSVLSGQTPLAGLDEKQVNEYLPRIIGISPSAHEFGKEVRKFWANFFLEVPQNGSVLNISTTDNGDPVNLQDWITYQWLKKHPLVADNIEQFKSDPNKEYYIHDPEIELKKKNVATKTKKEAYKHFITLTTGKVDDDKINRIIRILTGANPHKMNEMEKENFLDKYVQENPDRFIEVVTDKDLDTRAEIDEMIEKGVLHKIGNSIMFVDDPIGHSMEEAILFFNNKKESSTVSILRQRLKEANNSVVEA